MSRYLVLHESSVISEHKFQHHAHSARNDALELDPAAHDPSTRSIVESLYTVIDTDPESPEPIEEESEGA